MHQTSTIAVKPDGVDARSWRTAVAELGQALGCSPRPEVVERNPLELGFIGLSGVGKSSLLNALVASTHELLPSGGVGPLTGVPVHFFHAPAAKLRVKYCAEDWLRDALAKLDNGPTKLTSNEIARLSLICTGDQYATRDLVWLAQATRHALSLDAAPPDDRQRTHDALRGVRDLLRRAGTVREWESSIPDGPFFRRIHDHTSGPSAAFCERIEIGWPSAILEAGAVLVDLPGLGMASDAYSCHTVAWLEHAKAIAIVVDRAGVAESLVASLRASGFLSRVLAGDADLIGITTKLDQVTDDRRRRNRSDRSWAHCFRNVAADAQVELSSQIEAAFRCEHNGDLGAWFRSTIRVFGVSSREYRRVVDNDPDDRPRLLVSESSGVPAVRRALVGLSRLRSNPWISQIFERARRSSDVSVLLPRLFSLVDMEGS